jgi:bifunctional UDP-N-acetylglucosamine pyrophosphorylase/glucosamine-1-phosphate N-acetyltransferase
VKKDEIYNRYGNVTLDGERVVEIVEKPTQAPKNGYRLLAIYFLPKVFVENLEKKDDDEFYFEKALSAFAKAKNVFAVITEKPTITLKYAWDLLGIKDYLLSKLTPFVAPNAFVAKDALMTGNIVIEAGASVMEGACIKGPAYIGKRATVGNRAIVRGGVIVEEDATIGSQMEIKNALVMESTTTHSGFIGDSVIGKETKIAAGFITANARLDRQSVKTVVKEEKVDTGLRHLGVIVGSNDNIGIRVSAMPGVIIGNHVVVGPSTTMMKNITDNTKYYTKFQEVVEENE